MRPANPTHTMAVLAALILLAGLAAWPPASEHPAPGESRAGLLGIPTERVQLRDRAEEALLAAELESHQAVLEHQARVRLRRLAPALEELSMEGFSCVPARVEDVDLAEDARLLVVSAGYAQGIPQNAVALTYFKQLAGLVVEVTPDRSRVLLITDPSSAVPVTVRDEDAEEGPSDNEADEDEQPELAIRGAVLGGQGTGRSAGELLRFTYIEGEGPFALGDILMTSGEGELYPEGLPVGRVAGSPVTMEHLTPPYAEVRPLADIGSLREVILAWRSPGEGGGE